MKRTTLTWIGLLVLTAISALLATLNSTYAIIVILVLAALKLLGVSFIFMELNKAHSFWKISMLFFLIALVGIVVYLLF